MIRCLTPEELKNTPAAKVQATFASKAFAVKNWTSHRLEFDAEGLEAAGDLDETTDVQGEFVCAFALVLC